MAKKRQPTYSAIEAEIILELKDIVEESISDIAKEVLEIKEKVDALDKISVIVQNGTTKKYTMNVTDAIQNIYNDISELKHKNDEMTLLIPEKPEKIAKRIFDKTEIIYKFLRGLLFIALLIAAILGFIKITNLNY